MSKFFFALAMAVAMTATASAHIWNRPAPRLTASHLRVSPCPVSYDFQRGFCVPLSPAKEAWFARAIDGIL